MEYWAFRQPERHWVNMSNTCTAPQCLDTIFICLHPHAGLHLPLPQPWQWRPREVGWARGDEGLMCGHSPRCQAVPTQKGVTTGCPCWSHMPELPFVPLYSSKSDKQQKFFLGSRELGWHHSCLACSDSSSVTAGRAWAGAMSPGAGDRDNPVKV